MWDKPTLLFSNS
jgi:hypothetical protein